MRINTAKGLKAFTSGGYYRGKRDLVARYTWFLHGNKIAYFDGDVLVITSCGYRTRTTMDRLNAIFRAYSNIYLRQMHFEWYLYAQNGRIRQPWAGTFTLHFDNDPRGIREARDNEATKNPQQGDCFPTES